MYLRSSKVGFGFGSESGSRSNILDYMRGMKNALNVVPEHISCVANPDLLTSDPDPAF